MQSEACDVDEDVAVAVDEGAVVGSAVVGVTNSVVAAAYGGVCYCDCDDCCDDGGGDDDCLLGSCCYFHRVRSVQTKNTFRL